MDRAHSVGGKGAKRERKEKKKTEYRVTLVTGHQPHAGTSANVSRKDLIDAVVIIMAMIYTGNVSYSISLFFWLEH